MRHSRPPQTFAYDNDGMSTLGEEYDADAPDAARWGGEDALALASALPASPGGDWYGGGGGSRLGTAERLSTGGAPSTARSGRSAASSRSRRSQKELREGPSGRPLLDEYLAYRDGPHADRAVSPYHRYRAEGGNAGESPASRPSMLPRRSSSSGLL